MKRIGKVKRREKTDNIFVVYENYKGASARKVDNSFAREGYLYPPFHVYIDGEGRINETRDLEGVASFDLVANETSVYIVVDVPNIKRVTLKQERAINKLINKLKEKHPNIKVNVLTSLQEAS